MTYPIAETFISVQGEGTYTGTPMLFIRLAGCNVGKYTPIALQQPLETDPSSLRVLRASNPTHSICTAWDGTKFLCDTDYHKAEEVDEVVLVKRGLNVKHICISGGEPFLHDLLPLLRHCGKLGIRVHIETSGTLPIPNYTSPWITCSPKWDFDRGNYYNVQEWKFVVGPDTTEKAIREFLDPGDPRPVYLQPLGDLKTHFPESLARCWELLQIHPEWKLSAQLHKYLGVR